MRCLPRPLVDDALHTVGSLHRDSSSSSAHSGGATVKYQHTEVREHRKEQQMETSVLEAQSAPVSTAHYVAPGAAAPTPTPAVSVTHSSG